MRHATRRPFSKSCSANFATASRVLEIGSGTGQHAVTVRASTSGICTGRPAISMRIMPASVPGSRLPVLDNVLRTSVHGCSRARRWRPAPTTRCFHRIPHTSWDIDAVRKMFALVGRACGDEGVFCLYGPFRKRRRVQYAEQCRFRRESAQARNPSMGIRDLETLDEFAAASRSAASSACTRCRRIITSSSGRKRRMTS